jgi:hypothetical protein
MGLAVRLYEQLTDATEERARFRLIADAIGALEDSWPRPGEVARVGDVRESELRLRKEIKQVDLQIEQVRVELKAMEANLSGAMHRQTRWVIGAVGTVVGLVTLLDWLLA